MAAEATAGPAPVLPAEQWEQAAELTISGEVGHFNC